MSIRFKSRKTGKVHDSEMCEPNLNLLAHAQAIELEIGSRCGGYGECGGDRVKILSAPVGSLSPVSEPELKHLSSMELSNGWRLACQCFPERKGDSIEVEVP